MRHYEDSLIVWSDYMKYRAKLRGFELSKIENILRHSGERYFDTVTRRLIVVGKDDNRLVIIPYEIHGNEITPLQFMQLRDTKSNSDLKQGNLDMNKTRMTYFKDEDIIHIVISDEKEANSIELLTVS